MWDTASALSSLSVSACSICLLFLDPDWAKRALCRALGLAFARSLGDRSFCRSFPLVEWLGSVGTGADVGETESDAREGVCDFDLGMYFPISWFLCSSGNWSRKCWHRSMGLDSGHGLWSPILGLKASVVR